jgi:Leucine-rich repeat (LRR) protein
LIRFYVFSNALSGAIPETIAHMRSPQFFDCFSNRLEGPIPASIGQMHALVHFFAYNNLLTDAIPDVFANLTNLQELRLQSNLLTGTIPSSLSVLKNLTRLLLHSNLLTGSIPSFLFALPSVREIDLHSNSFNGGISVPPVDNSPLEILHLMSNKLTGSIPFDLCGYRNMSHLFVSQNYFTDFPACAFPSLTLLDASANLLSLFPFDSFESRFPSLIVLNLASNQLFGDFPRRLFLGGLKLRSLSLAANRFSGMLPIYPCGFYNPVTRVVEHADTDTGLTFLDLSGCSIIGISGMALADECAFCDQSYSTLTTLRLSNTTLRAYATFSIAQPSGVCSANFSSTDIFARLPALRVLDVSHNDLRVSFDVLFQQLPLLTSLDISGNENARFQETLEEGTQALFHFASSSAYPFTSSIMCYQATVQDQRLSVTADPSFYSFKNCVCRPGFYGKPPNCQPCLSANAQCPFPSDSIAFSLDPTTAWNQSGNVFAHAGFYSTPNIPIERQSLDESYPKAVLQCAHAGTDISPCQPSGSSICQSGYEGRLCSKCSKGFFVSGDRCFACPTGETLVLFGLTVIVVALLLLIASFHVGGSSSGFTKILLFFVQALYFIRASMPSGLYAAAGSASSFSLASAAGPECFFRTGHLRILSRWPFLYRPSCAVLSY